MSYLRLLHVTDRPAAFPADYHLPVDSLVSYDQSLDLTLKTDATQQSQYSARLRNTDIAVTHELVSIIRAIF